MTFAVMRQKQSLVPFFIILLLFAVVAVSGCAAPAGGAASSSAVAGVEKCQTTRECLAYGYGLNASVRSSAASALKSGAIRVDDAQRILATTDLARSALDEGRKLEGVDPSTAAGKVQYAIGLLSAGQTFLRDRGVK